MVLFNSMVIKIIMTTLILMTMTILTKNDYYGDYNKHDDYDD